MGRGMSPLLLIGGIMATWNEVKSAVTSGLAFKFETVDNNVLKIDVAVKDGRSQIVYLANGGDKITIMSAVCELAQVNLDALFQLEAFQDMPYGASASGKFLVLKHSTLFETLDAAEIATPMVELAFLADTLENAITGGDSL